MPAELQIFNAVDKELQRELAEFYKQKRMKREYEALQR